jgi:hypothetical protein
VPVSEKQGLSTSASACQAGKLERINFLHEAFGALDPGLISEQPMDGDARGIGSDYQMIR